MSRSRRAKPIFGITTARTEKDDKRIWHKRLRTVSRTEITVLTPANASEYMPVAVPDVSNPYSMSKDGRQYWPASRQIAVATRNALGRSKSPREIKVLKIRALKKWAGK